MLRTSADSALQCFAEPILIAPVVVWDETMGRDTPAGIIIGSKDRPVTASQLLQLLEQLARMSRFVAAQVEQMVVSNKQLIADQEKKLHGQSQGSEPSASAT
jgi:hypothetical protein